LSAYRFKADIQSPMSAFSNHFLLSDAQQTWSWDSLTSEFDPEQTMPIAIEFPGDNAFLEPGFLSICRCVKSQVMKTSVISYPKPLSSAEIVTLDVARFSEEDNRKIDAWAKATGNTRLEAIHQLVEIGLIKQNEVHHQPRGGDGEPNGE
jgi:hypothetical protein